MTGRPSVTDAVKGVARALVRRFGLDLVPLDHALPLELERRRLLRSGEIDVLVDAGANEGQYARTVRADGYKGRIVSFEPLTSAFGRLAAHAAKDAAWECRRIALGSRDGTGEIHVAGNSVSSSLLPLTPAHLAGAPAARYVTSETVGLARLDSLASELVPAESAVFLKLDVQGFEREVLDGARATLPRVVAVESELSLTPLYEGQPLFGDVVAGLDESGFDLVALERSFSDPASGKLLQVDGLFLRRVSRGRVLGPYTE